ncbi:MAG: glutaminase [Fusobacteriaceae bacterium]
MGVFGPALDEKGNSVAGVSLLENLSGYANLSVF